jgi:hypothetical protein
MFRQKHFFYLLFVLFIAAFAMNVRAQLPTGVSSSQVGFDSQGRPIKRDSTNKHLEHRDPLEDSITISYKYFDSSRTRKLDSSINDFYTRFPVPYYYVDLGNFGTAAHSLFFDPVMKPGFDAGFHAYDIYDYTLENTKFFQSTRPYTELAYLLGSSGEQMIDILHTQKRGKNFDFTFQYRFINSPGIYKSQYTDHNNLRFNASYQSTNKRYGFYLIYFSNKIHSGENGGIDSVSQLTSLGNGALSSPFDVNTRLGINTSTSRNFFDTYIPTGTLYKQHTFMLRQYYDLGQKDSIVTDSFTYKLFYPRLRFQHTFTYTGNTYSFEDDLPDDSTYGLYFNYKNATYPFFDTLRFQDRWLSFTNEFSVISFPEKNNLNQFLKLSAALQTLSGAFDYTNYAQVNEKNISVSAEYRNRTRNQKWDVEASGQLYVTGSYTGDYSAFISLQKQLGKKVGTLQVGFQDVNRTPSYIFESPSSFPTVPGGNYNKENIAKLFAVISLPNQNLTLSGSYYAVTNYVYFDSLYTSQQDSKLFNVLHLELDKKIRLSNHFNYYAEAHLQQTTGNPPVSLPLFFIRNRIAFEGNFYHNLYLSTGFEISYYTPYHADNYSPLNGQFFYQNTYSTSGNRPTINYFLDFRIKSFKAFVRAENLNTLNYNGSFGFTDHNFTAPFYPTRALWIHFGFWWSFVN